MVSRRGLRKTQYQYVPLTLLLALFTYIGAHTWERYLARFNHINAEWEHHLVAALPYLAATFMLTTLAYRELDPISCIAGAGTLGCGAALCRRGHAVHIVKASGLLALALASASFYFQL